MTNRHPGDKPVIGPPDIEVVESDVRHIKAAVSSSWVGTLEERIGNVPGLSVAEIILRATAGADVASHTFDLPRLGDPSFFVGATTSEVVSLSHLPAEILNELAAVLPEHPVSIIGAGMFKHRAVATLEARMLTFEPGSATLRRYEQIDVEVRLDAVVPHTLAKTMAAQKSPHLAITSSVLSEGTWFKFPVNAEGVYRVDLDYLVSLGLSPQGVDPARVRVFGNGGLPLPALNSDPRPIDLVEQPMFASHDGDTVFEEGEFVLFFATGVQNWYYDSVIEDWSHVTHPFSNSNYYFIQTDGPPGMRLETVPWPSLGSPESVSQFEDRYLVDNDLIHLEQDGSGSGLEWFGALVDTEVPRRSVLDIAPAGIAAGTVRYRSRVAVRSNPAATIRYEYNGSVLASAVPGVVNLGAGSELGFMARAATIEFTRDVPADGRLQLDLRLIGQANGPNGWLDWLEVYYPRELRAENGLLRFSTEPGQRGQFEYRLTGFPSEPHVWDVTTVGASKRLAVQSAGGDWIVQFEVSDGSPREFVALATNAAGIASLDPGEPVTNQNLHGIQVYPEFIIVTPTEFRTVAEDHAARRRQEGMSVAVATVGQIYNEFSGGVPDARAVRDYFRFLYDRGHDGDRELQFALLLGDGHFDYRSITDDAESPLNPNWIFPYQTDNTLLKGSSYTSDDYFGLLDGNEGIWRWTGDSGITFERVDIGIGRWPVETIEEARLVLSKIESYESNESQGPWRTRYMFVADDGPAGSSDDKDLHTQNADVVAEAVVQRFPEVNTDKIYAISYPAVTTANGRRIPEANRDIIEALNDGTLVWNYSGHGGITGLADERIFTREDIDELDNEDRLTVFITATCTFGRFDTDREKSGAERLLLKESGGSVALFSTVRVVVTWVNPNTFNLGLNLELNKHLLKREADGKGLRLGDVLRITKNSSVGLQGNNRKFNLLGDPTMRLGLPEREVNVTAINGVSVDTASIKLRALERVNLEGAVSFQDGQLDPTFEGAVEVTVFDAKRSVEIDEDKQRHIASGQYTVQNDLIYRGQVAVKEGRFSTEFVVPRDIAFSDLPGRITMYASSSGTDGFGATENVLVGGTADNPVTDAAGPEVRLFLNDTSFVSGGLTTSDPLLIVQLNDESGINTVGSGVGHDMLLVLDGDEQNAIEIGDRFEGTLGSFQKGTVSFKLPVQEPGDHTLAVKVWDVVNNSSEQVLEYVVTAGDALAINNVFNYPNPMANETRFVFEHNQAPGTPAEIEIDIYTVSGRLVQTLNGLDVLPSGVLPGGPVQIPWNGHDHDLDKVSPGIYLYKVKVAVDLPSGERDSAEHLGRLAVVG
jgi:hypothetical protein